MHIIISNSSEEPIYEQIVTNIKNSILNGTLSGGEALPSIRALAKDLKISNITTKRAYGELEKAGFIESNSTKGYFVKTKNKEFLKEEILTKVESGLIGVIGIAKTYKISKDEVYQILEALYEEE